MSSTKIHQGVVNAAPTGFNLLYAMIYYEKQWIEMECELTVTLSYP
jgi:hypothetical protein